MADDAAAGKKSYEALQEVVKALAGLEPEEQARVLRSAAAFFGAGAPAPTIPDRVVVPEGGGAGGEDAGGRPVSLREFVNQVAPSSGQQKIATFAYYRERYEKNAKFARADLLPYFSRAKIKEPGNYARDFALAVREGWIHEDGADSYLTNTGEKAVEERFAAAAIKSTRKKAD